MQELRTDRFKLKEIFPEKAKAYAQKLKIKAGELEYVRKGIPIDPKDIEIKEGERAAIRLVTTPHLDRDGEILMPHGAILDDFRQSPTVMYAHDYRSLPIGSDQWIKQIKEGILAKTVYAKHQFAEDVYQCVKDKHLNCNSVGFIPVETVTPDDKKQFEQIQEVLEKDYGILRDESIKAKNIYTKWIMLEHSDVPIPSNAQSLNLAVSKGELVIQSERLKKDLEIEIIKEKIVDREIEVELEENESAITKPETTENYHRIPVEDADKHEGHRIRTITISAEQGIKAIYCGQCKVILTYLFDVDKFSMAEAQAWVREHKEFKVSEEETNMEEETIGKGVIAYHDYGVADEGESWDGPAAMRSEIDVLKKICAWYDSENPDVKNSYKLPHHKPDGLKAVWGGVRAAMGAVLGARGGVDIPSGDKRGVYNHLSKHYAAWDKEPPEFKEYGEDYSETVDYLNLQTAIKELIDQIAEIKEGRVLSAKNRTLVKETIDALAALKERLEELHDATEPPAREKGKELKEDEFILEKNGKRGNLDDSIAGIVEKLFEGDKLGKMMNDAIKEALDVGIKKKLGKVE